MNLLGLVHVDILTPKQVMFFTPVVRELESLGNKCLVTTRKYREVNQLLELKKVEAEVIGRHGGPEFYHKAWESASRTLKLIRWLHRKAPEVSLSFSSPEAARASFGLRIPHVCVSDSPHSTAVSLLTIPLSRTLLSPRIIPIEAWTRMGIRKNRIIRYNALDPVVWLRDGAAPKAVDLGEYEVDQGKPILTLRPEESYAAYLQTPKSHSFTPQLASQILKKLANRCTLLIIPRYERQLRALRSRFGKKAVVLEKIVDGPGVLRESSIFIGAGGTMTAEAALLGVPTISCFPSSPTYVDKFLMDKGLIERFTNPVKAMSRIDEILRDLDGITRERSEKAHKLLAQMEDPLKKICSAVESCFAGN